jgi:hypothetical protein
MEAISGLPRRHDIDADYSPQYVQLARIIRDKIESGDGVGSGVDGDPEGSAGKLLDVASGGGGHGSTIIRNTDFRSTTRSTGVAVGVRIMLSSWEPPIGIEPMTYALRVRRSNRLS